MQLEAHDANRQSGTLAARVDHGIDYPYQLEMFVQELIDTTILARRFYGFKEGTVLVVYGCDDNEVYYVGRDEDWEGEWDLPFLYPHAMGIATAIIGRDVRDMSEAAEWAQKALVGNVATATVLDSDGILAAWELIEGTPTLVSQSPRPLPQRRAA